MGISDWFGKRSGTASEKRRSEHIAHLIAQIEGAERKTGGTIAQMALEDMQILGDAVLEVEVTTAGALVTFSTRKEVAAFVKKYNKLLAESGEQS